MLLLLHYYRQPTTKQLLQGYTELTRNAPDGMPAIVTVEQFIQQGIAVV